MCRFPKEERFLIQWKNFTGRCNDWVPSRWSAICSRHFKESDFRKSATRKILKRNAIPTIVMTKKINGKQSRDNNINLQSFYDQKSDTNAKSQNITTSESKCFKENNPQQFNDNVVPISSSVNLNSDSNNQIFNIPEKPPNSKGRNLENSIQVQSSISVGQQYEPNISGNSSTFNYLESIAAPCRLCGNEDHITNSFMSDYEIFGMIQKCLPTLNIRQNDFFSKEVCSTCLEQLENFNSFIDQVILHQKTLIQNHQPIHTPFQEKPPTVISSVKIKQEPITNIKLNIKQEIVDTHNPQYNEKTSQADDLNCSDLFANQDHDENFLIQSEVEEQKFHFRDSNSLATREIVKNCDIIEIINLEDGYIDIPDDELDESQNKLDQKMIKESYSKVIDNKEIKIIKKVIEDVEPTLKSQFYQSPLLQYVIEEHNYTKNSETQVDQIFKINEYKQEQLEDQVLETDQLNIDEGENGKNDSLTSNYTISKIEVTNSPKKIVPKNENIPEKQNIFTKVIDNQCRKFSEHQFNFLNSNEEFNTIFHDGQDKFNFMDFKEQILISEEKNNAINRPFNSLKQSNKSNIVVINESILKPGDIKPFELRKCYECGLHFFSIDSFNEHSKVHRSELILEDMKTTEAICTHFCVLCESNFDSFFELLKHRSKCRVKNLHSIKKTNKISKSFWKCPMCLKIFNSKLALNNHRKYICRFPQTSNHFICKFCGFYFKKWILCRNHEKFCKNNRLKNSKDQIVRNEENNQAIQRNTDEKENGKNLNDQIESIEQNNYLNRYNCETCDRSYTRYQNLIRHKKIHRPKSEWNYKCGSCDKRFDRMYDLKIHLKSAECPCVPSKPDLIFFVCQICGKKFKTLQILKEHGVTHSDQLPFVCPICNKSFKALRNLRQHKITHTNAKTVQCDLCDKTFKRLNGLLQHKRGFHLKIKPHICNICNHAYSLKGDMIRCKHKYLTA